MGEKEFSCHAARRAHEHYGLDLSLDDIKRLAEDCRSGKAVLLAKTASAENRLVRHNGTVLVAVYDRACHRIRTFMPRTSKFIDRVRQKKKLASGWEGKPQPRFMRRRYVRDNDDAED